MAIYHCHISTISRSSGRSSVAAAAYRSGEKLTNERDGVTHDYTDKQWQIAYSEIMLPSDLAEKRPDLTDRYMLWNEVESAEKRVDAQTSREIEVALPNEFTREEQIEVLRNYVKDNFVKEGMCADINIHDKGDGNPHAHIMLTTRNIDYNTGEFMGKNRDWNDRRNVDKWREAWANQVNDKFYKLGMKERIDHRSYESQGVDKIPTVHLGACAKMESRGIETDRGNYNRDIKSKVAELQRISDEIKALTKAKEQLEKLEEQEKQLEEEKRKAEEVKTTATAPRSGADLRSEESRTRETETPDKSPEMLVLEMKVNMFDNYHFEQRKELLQTEIKQAEDKINQTQERLKSLVDRREEYQGYHNDYNTEIEILKEERKNLGLFNGKQKAEIDQHISDLEKAKDQLHNKLGELDGNIKKAQGDIEHYENYIKKRQSDIRVLDYNIKQNEAELSAYKKQLRLAPNEYQKQFYDEAQKLKDYTVENRGDFSLYYKKKIQEKQAEIKEREKQKELAGKTKEQEQVRIKVKTKHHGMDR